MSRLILILILSLFVTLLLKNPEGKKRRLKCIPCRFGDPCDPCGPIWPLFKCPPANKKRLPCYPPNHCRPSPCYPCPIIVTKCPPCCEVEEEISKIPKAPKPPKYCTPGVCWPKCQPPPCTSSPEGTVCCYPGMCRWPCSPCLQNATFCPSCCSLRPKVSG